MLIIVNKLKNMTCPWPHVSQITTNRIFATEFLLILSDVKSLVTRVLSDNLEKTSPKTLTRKGQGNIKAIAKLFALQANEINDHSNFEIFSSETEQA